MTEIITYQAGLQQAFIDLNTEWLEEHFYVETHDKEIFENIEEIVLAPGGQIFFVLVDGIVAGTVAMQKVNDTTFELAKMAVSKRFRGKGLSKRLMNAAINFAMEQKAEKIFLLSNRKLAPAIQLYTQFGFSETPVELNDYARADIQMELLLPGYNVWNAILLEDYERHMTHGSVVQMQLLSSLTKKYLDKYKPASIMFLGIAGGNGLEHIDTGCTSEVIGIDINRTYLEKVKQRFEKNIPGLILRNLDISKTSEAVSSADLVWAALVLEYTGIEACLEFISNNLSSNGVAIITIQSNNGITSVSPTGVEGIKIVEKMFKVVQPAQLEKVLSLFGLKKTGGEENFLPNGKSFKTYEIRKYDSGNTHS